MFIKRKPKPNGMLIWSATTFVNHPASISLKLPFFLHLIPHLEPNDGGGEEAVRIMMKQWKFSTKPHIVADSGFGSFKLLQNIITWGATATLSIPTNESDKLAPFMAYNLPVGHWRACINTEKIIFSVECKQVDAIHGGTSITHKYIITNAFNCNVKPFGIVNITETPSSIFLNYIIIIIK